MKEGLEKLNFLKLNAFPIVCVIAGVALEYNGSNHWFWLIVMSAITAVFPSTKKKKS